VGRLNRNLQRQNSPSFTFEAIPFRSAVIVPAEKFPFASLATILPPVLVSDAVVALLLTLPAVLIVAGDPNLINFAGNLIGQLIETLEFAEEESQVEKEEAEESKE